MNKKIRKAIMDRTRLRNRFLRTRSNENKEAYNKQLNYCVSLFRKIKHKYYNNLIIGRLPVTNHFGKISSLFFSIKANTITLLEEDLKLEENNDIVKTFTDFFTSFVSKLNIPRYQDPFIIAINNQNMDRRFSFQEIKKSEIKQESLNLDSCRACQGSDLPTKITKTNSDIFIKVIHKELNKGVEVDNF